MRRQFCHLTTCDVAFKRSCRKVRDFLVKIDLAGRATAVCLIFMAGGLATRGASVISYEEEKLFILGMKRSGVRRSDLSFLRKMTGLKSPAICIVYVISKSTLLGMKYRVENTEVLILQR